MIEYLHLNMFKYLSVFLFIGLILGQNPDLSENDFKKNELLKQFYDKLILPEMPGGKIDQKIFF